MEREGGRAGLAGLARAGEEVEGEELHGSLRRSAVVGLRSVWSTGFGGCIVPADLGKWYSRRRCGGAQCIIVLVGEGLQECADL